MSYIGLNIKKLRKKRNITHEKLAEIFSITVDNLFNREMKEYRNLASRLGSIFEQERSNGRFNYEIGRL